MKRKDFVGLALVSTLTLVVHTIIGYLFELPIRDVLSLIGIGIAMSVMAYNISASIDNYRFSATKLFLGIVILILGGLVLLDVCIDSTILSELAEYIRNYDPLTKPKATASTTMALALTLNTLFSFIISLFVG